MSAYEPLRAAIGPYRAQALLGRGGDGEVWLAEEPLTGRAVAVKLLHDRDGRGSQARTGRLVREYQILRGLERADPTLPVPRARRLAVEGTRHYLVLDYLAARELGAYADKLAPADRAPSLRQVLGRVALAIAGVHAAGVIHGDLKPSCMLVDARGAAWLLDFGAAHLADDRALTRAIDERFMTPAYAAPEVLAKQAPTEASDVWSFGVTVWRMMLEGLPFGRGERREVRARVAASQPEALATALEAATEWPFALRNLVSRSLAIDPAARPTASEWAEALGVGELLELATEQRSSSPVTELRPLGDDVASLERWTDALLAQGRLGDAQSVPAPRDASDHPARWAVLQGRWALAGRAPSSAVDEALEAVAQGVVAGSVERVRWTLQRHFGVVSSTSRPASLSTAWRALEAGDMGAARTAAELALEEAMALRLDAAEADARLVLAELERRAGAVAEAEAQIDRALERRFALGRCPGTGEIAAEAARLATQRGAFGRARALLLAAERDAATPVDRAHLLLALAELERALGHRAVASDALRLVLGELELTRFDATSALATRALVMRLALDPSPQVLSQGGERLALFIRRQLPRHAAELAAALADARRMSGDEPGAELAVAIACDAAQATEDLPGALLGHAAARVAPPELVARAEAAGLYGLAAQLLRAAGDDAAAWRCLERLSRRLDVGDQYALALEPWAVRAYDQSRRARRGRA